jgi:ankyrin repeat protein
MEPAPVPKRARASADENDTNALVALLCRHVPDLTLLRHLSPGDLGRLAQTCRRLHTAIADTYFWSRLSPVRTTSVLARRATAWNMRDMYCNLSARVQVDDMSPLAIPASTFLGRRLAPLIARAAESLVILRWLCVYGRLDAFKLLFEHTRRSNGNVLPFRNIEVVAAACRSGDLSLVRYLYEVVGVTRDEMSATSAVVTAACKYGWTEIVAYLFETVQVTPATVHMHSYAALVEACRHGHIDVVRYLVDFVGLTRTDFLDETTNEAPSEACKNGHTTLVRYLFEKFDLPASIIQHDDYSPLREACWCGYIDIVRELLSRVRTGADIAEIIRECVLSAACRSNTLAVVQYLCEWTGMRMPRDSPYIHDAFEAACHAGHVPIVRYLTDHFGLDTAFISASRLNIPHIVAEAGHLDLLRYLCEEVGLAPADIRINNGSTIRKALLKSKVDIAHCLIQYGQLTPDDMEVVRTLITPGALYTGDVRVLQLLFDHVGLTATDILSQHAYETAVNQDQLAAVRCILENAQTDDPSTHRHLVRGITASACRHKKPDIVKYMVETGGLTAEDLRADSNEILQAAMVSGDTRIIDYIQALI